MHDALRLRGRARGVEHEQHVFGVHRLRRTARLGLGQRVVPPRVVVVPGNVLFRALDDQHMLDARATQHGLVDDVLERDDLAAAPRAIARDDHPARRVLHTITDSGCREATKDDGVDSADASARQHRDRQLGHHAEVDRHAVGLADAVRLECASCTLDISE